MPETYTLRPERLAFASLQPLDQLVVTTGQGPEAWRYDFTVAQFNGQWPSGNLIATNPGGQSSDSYTFEFHGFGRWTTRRQNPVQQQELAFTAYYDGLLINNFIVGKIEGSKDRVIFDAKGQTISAIEHIPYQENALLNVLGAGSDRMSVAQIKEALAVQTAQLPETIIRQKLKVLQQAGRVAMLPQRRQLFQIVPSS